MPRPDPASVRSAIVRCAIYTRKSTEDGLEQSFNSLDAQREACAAYILSQRHEGWTLVPGDYDDGGFSGGTMERPALKRLLAEVAAGRVDVIVVYKVDRLTRNLGDFARIVDVLDAASASFVSITQAFNTTTSMGRLTLNVLLSFAQFEREVTGERIRDKIAASKAKGMWMGGVVPLGYRVEARKLIIDEAKPGIVRRIFALYLRLGSVQALEAELDVIGIRGRARRARGALIEPRPMSRGALYLMLRNRMYVGDICHKGTPHRGEHDAILDAQVFDRVQALLTANKAGHQSGANAAHLSLLAGILWDAHGRRMSPSHSNKGPSRRYRYYVSRTDGPEKEKPVWRVPAGDIESIVVGRLRAFLTDQGAMLDAIGSNVIDAVALDAALFEAKRTAEQLGSVLPHELRALVLRFVARVEVHDDRVMLQIKCAVLSDDDDSENAQTERRDEPVELSFVARLVRAGKEVRLVVGPSESSGAQQRDPALVKLIVKAHAARAALMAASHMSVEEIARSEGQGRDYFGVLLRLSWLAPDITNAMLDGRQPGALTRQGLARMAGVPITWAGQRNLIRVPALARPHSLALRL